MIHKKQLADTMMVYVYGGSTVVKVADLSVKEIPIQELMIYLTEKREDIK